MEKLSTPWRAPAARSAAKVVKAAPRYRAGHRYVRGLWPGGPDPYVYSYSRVDLVFISAGLAPFVRDGTARIYDGPGVRQASDHRPVFVVLELK